MCSHWLEWKRLLKSKMKWEKKRQGKGGQPSRATRHSWHIDWGCWLSICAGKSSCSARHTFSFINCFHVINEVFDANKRPAIGNTRRIQDTIVLWEIIKTHDLCGWNATWIGMNRVALHALSSWRNEILKHNWKVFRLIVRSPLSSDSATIKLTTKKHVQLIKFQFIQTNPFRNISF